MSHWERNRKREEVTERWKEKHGCYDACCRDTEFCGVGVHVKWWRGRLSDVGWQPCVCSLRARLHACAFVCMPANACLCICGHAVFFLPSQSWVCWFTIAIKTAVDKPLWKNKRHFGPALICPSAWLGNAALSSRIQEEFSFSVFQTETLWKVFESCEGDCHTGLQIAERSGSLSYLIYSTSEGETSPC